jgi:hypothetical protein
MVLCDNTQAPYKCGMSQKRENSERLNMSSIFFEQVNDYDTQDSKFLIAGLTLTALAYCTLALQVDSA